MLAVMVALAAVTSIISVIFWPGHMDLDTLDEFWQAQGGHYNDWHTPVLSGLWHLLMMVGLRSPGWVLAGGVLTLLVGLYLLLRVLLPRPWAVLLAVLVFVFPPVLGYAVELGTDSWFASSILCAFGFAARSARTSGRSRIVSAILATACAFLAQAARPTTAPAVLALFCALALTMLPASVRGWRRALSTVAVGATATALLVGSVLGVQRFVFHAAQLHVEQGTYAYDLVQLSVREHEVLLPPDVYPRQDLGYLVQFSDVISVNQLWYGEHAAIKQPVEGAQLDSLQRAWVDAIQRYPYGYLRMRAATARRQLTVDGPAILVFYGTPTFPAQPTGYGFSPAHPTLDRKAAAYGSIGTTDGAIHGGLAQRVWMYVLVLVVFAAASFRSRRPTTIVLFFLSAAVLTYITEILLLAPGVTYRYMYPAVPTGTVLFLVLAIGTCGWLWTRLVRRHE